MKKAMPIEWHKECSKNEKASLARDERDLARLQEQIAKLRGEIDFHDQQIIEAEKRGMTEFDCDRLLVKRPRS